MLPVLRAQTLLPFPEDGTARSRDKHAVLFSLEVLLTVQRVESNLRAVFDLLFPPVAKASPRLWTGQLGGVDLSSLPFHDKYERELRPIVAALRRIHLVPQVLPEEHIVQLVKDVLPERAWQTMTDRANAAKATEGTPLPPNDTAFSSAGGIGTVRSFFGSSIHTAPPTPATHYLVPSSSSSSLEEDADMTFPQFEWLICVVAHETMDSAVRMSSSPVEREVSMWSR